MKNYVTLPSFKIMKTDFQKCLNNFLSNDRSNLQLYCLDSLRKHPFLLALRRWERFARNVPSGEERAETDVFEGYSLERCSFTCELPCSFSIHFLFAEETGVGRDPLLRRFLKKVSGILLLTTS